MGIEKAVSKAPGKTNLGRLEAYRSRRDSSKSAFCGFGTLQTPEPEHANGQGFGVMKGASLRPRIPSQYEMFGRGLGRSLERPCDGQRRSRQFRGFGWFRVSA